MRPLQEITTAVVDLQNGDLVELPNKVLTWVETVVLWAYLVDAEGNDERAILLTTAAQGTFVFRGSLQLTAFRVP